MSYRRDEILDAALALADEQGLDAVSMRAVAARVGVTPMALYPHIGSKEALLDGLVDRLLAQLLPAVDQDAGPTGRLMALARAVRGLAGRHPNAIRLLLSRPAVTPDAVRLVDVLYRALLDAGVPPPQVPRMERMVSTFVLGFAVSEAGGRFTGGTLDPRGRRALFSAQPMAHHELARWLDEPTDWDAEFEADLADLIALVMLVASPDAPRSGTGPPRPGGDAPGGSGTAMPRR